MRLAGYCVLHLRSSDTSFATVILYGIRISSTLPIRCANARCANARGDA
jgi:hypothetical protein